MDELEMNDLPVDGGNGDLPVVGNKPVNLPSSASGLPTYVPLDIPNMLGGGGREQSMKMDSDEMYANLTSGNQSKTFEDIQGSILPDTSGRYKRIFPGRDYEEMHAQGQSTSEKWFNASKKFLGSGAAAFVGGTFGLLEGAGKYMQTGEFSSIYDNEVNRYFDRINKDLENSAPNYYTHAEQDAEWYSTANIFSANFLADKVFKNIGFSIGSMAGGFAWSAVFKMIGKANMLIRAGKSLEALQGMDKAIQATTKLGRFGAVSESLTSMSNKALQTLGQATLNSERGIISVMGSMGEASIEALGNANAFRDKMIDQYMKANGTMPTGADMDEINSYADHIGNYTFGMNVALLSATNTIMLPKILNSSKAAERRAMNEIAKESLEETTGQGIKTIAGVAEAAAASKYVASPYALERLAGKKIGGFVDKYMVKPASLFFAPSEAFEEGAQFAIQTGTEDYFNRAKENHEEISGFWNTLVDTLGNTMGEGVRKSLTTKEGLESILIGGISGGIQSSFSPFGSSTIRERGITGRGGYRARNTEIAMQELNKGNLTQSLRDIKKYTNIGFNSQQLRQEAIKQDDKKLEKDYERDYVQAYLMPRIKYGKVDGVREELNLYRQAASSEKGMDDLKADGVALQDETYAQFTQRLNMIQKTADELKTVYDTVNDKYSAVVDKDGNRKYTDEIVEKMVYSSGKILDYDTRLRDLNNALVGKGVNTLAIEEAMKASEHWSTAEVDKLADDEKVREEMLKGLAAISKSTPIEEDSSHKDLVDFATMLTDRQSFVNEYNNLKNNPDKYKTEDSQPNAPLNITYDEEGNPIVDTAEKPGKTVIIKTNVGDREITLGKEYFLGDVIDYNEKGKIVYRSPRLTVLGENEDGTVKIKDANGVIRDVSKAEFESYKLAPVDATLKNDKAKFFMENWNTMYLHYGIKRREDPNDPKSKLVPVRGRLKYNHDKEGILTFVYVDENGEVQETEVTGKMFVVSNKKYKHPILKADGILTAVQEKATEAFGKAKDTRAEAVLNKRLEILIELSEDLLDRQEKTKNLVESKKATIAASQKRLNILRGQIREGQDNRSKAVKFKKAAEGAITEAMTLSRTIEQLEREVEEHEAQLVDLENNLDFIDQFVDELEDAPIEMDDFIARLRDDRDAINDIIHSTNKTINLLHKMIASAQKAKDIAIATIHDLIERFEKKYPDAPFLYNKKPIFKEELQEVMEMIEFTQDGDVTPSESRIQNLQEHLDIVEGELRELENHLKGHDAILDKFEQKLEDYKKAIAEEQKISEIASLRKEVLGTMSKDIIQPVYDKPSFEAAPLKEDLSVVASTKAFSIDKPDKPLAEHHKRANHFGARLESFSNVDDIRGVTVTAQTEGQIMPGLTDHYLSDVTDQDERDELAKEAIFMVMVQTMEDGSIQPVDKNGVPIPGKTDKESPEEYNKRLRDNGIYQVYPGENLTYNKEDEDGDFEVLSMFRQDTDEDTVESLTEQFVKWRQDRLKETNLPDPDEIKASFGFAELNTYTDEKGKKKVDKAKRTPAEKAGLINPGGLNTDRLIMVATDNESITEGSVTFATPLGRVFLRMPNQGLAKLFNRKFNDKEAETIYSAVQQLAKNVFEEGEVYGPEKGEQNRTIVSWLESVVYWGVPYDSETKKEKPAGYNSMFFKEAMVDGKPRLRLFISGLNKSNAGQFEFTPTSIETNKELIIGLLQGMYHNVNATKTNIDSYSAPYDEITGFDSTGAPKVRTWPNYQTYLLSDKGFDAEGKLTAKRDDIPLTTMFRPLEGKDDTNRKGIYFTRKYAVDEFEIPEPKPKKEKKKPAKKEAAKKEPAKPKPGKTVDRSNPKNWALDGETTNKKVLANNLGAVEFTMDGEAIADLIPEDKIKEYFDPKTPLPKDLVAKIIKAGALQVNYEDADNLATLEEVTSFLMKTNKKMTNREAATNTAMNLVLTGIFRDAEAQLLDLIAPADDPMQDDDYIDQLTDLKAMIKGTPLDKITSILDEVFETLDEKDYEAWQGKLDMDALTAHLEKQLGGETDPDVVMAQVSKILLQKYIDHLIATQPTTQEEEEFEEAEDIEEEEEVEEVEEVEEEVEEPKTKKPAKTVVAAAPKETPPADQEIDEEWDSTDGNVDTTPLRAIIKEEIKDFTPEKWDDIESFVKVALPNVPFYRVKNVIKGVNGQQAWGMFHQGAVYVMENAEVGTAYHEVFEAIWKMFVGPKEKQQIINEFKNREGTYKDRESQTVIAYKDATPHQIKEALAEEFREKRLTGKDPVKSKRGGNLISRMFNQLLDFFRTFFTGKEAMDNTRKLFEKIGSGYYAKYSPYESGLSYAKKGIINVEDAHGDVTAELRSIIPQRELHDIIQQMTYMTLVSMSESNKSLFEITKQNKGELYPMLQADIKNRIKSKANLYDQMFKDGELSKAECERLKGNMKDLFGKVIKDWEAIKLQHADHLRIYNVEFDENDDAYMTAEENTGKQEYDSADKIDSFRKASSAIKLLFGTLSETEVVNGKLETKPSSIGGVILMPADKVNTALQNELYDSVNEEEMFNKLSTMALTNPNYAALYRRMTNQEPGESFDPTKLQDFDLQIMGAFWKTIKKQNADVVTIFILPTGEVMVSDTSLGMAAKQAQREMFEGIIDKIKKDKSPYFEYDRKTGKYKSKGLKNIVFGRELTQHVAFLKNLGIDFKLKDVRKLKGEHEAMFRTAVSGFQSSLSKIGDKVRIDGDIKDTSISVITTKTLNVHKHTATLGLLKAIIERTDYDSTYFNVNGERTQTFIGTNIMSKMYDTLSKVKNFSDLKNDKKYSHLSYLTTDVFSKGSLVMKKIFDLEGENPTGKRREGTAQLFKTVFVDGMVDQETGKKKSSSKMTLRQRLAQEINLNLSGIFLNLVPGDASIEHAVRLYNTKNPFVSEDTYKTKSYLQVFKDLLISEIDLAKDKRPVANNKDLRFFKAILESDPGLLKILDTGITKKADAETLYNDNEKRINAAIEEFIVNEANDSKILLESFGLVKATPKGYQTEDIMIGEKGTTLTAEALSTSLRTLAANYVIANMELHKLVYSDPYQYSDELKRIKNFNSPGQPLVSGSEKIMKGFDRVYNKGFKEGQIGFTNMARDFFRTVTLGDIFTVDPNTGYSKPFEETDGGGYITLQGYRLFKLLAGDWTDANERQYRHDMEYEEIAKGNRGKNIKFLLEAHEKNDPNEKSTYTPLKPIVRGSKANGRDYNDVVLDKFALVPLSYRIMHKINSDSNMIKLYEKMQNEKIDYAVFGTGRKVGAEVISPLFKNGEFNTEPFATPEEVKKNVKPTTPRAISNIPFSIVAVQAEVPSKDTPKVTQGSQITKLATMDYLEAGVPIDFMEGEDFDDRFVEWMKLETEEQKLKASDLYKEIKHNQALLVARLDEAVDSLYKKLGLKKTVVETEDEWGDTISEAAFEIIDEDKLYKTLKEEVAKREINYNIIDALEGFKDGDVVIEATPAYQQIRNILFSIADKSIVRPKISGGMKVQIPSSLLSENRVLKGVFTNKKGETKEYYESEALEFYSATRNKDNGKVETVNVCEIMVGRWFKSNKTDEELMDYFNNDPQGKKELAALMGVGFRIPTQKQNSIDVFKIKKFLPEAFGDSVVIPSGLVLKAGSDFDIDKLSLYFKNLYTDHSGDLRVVPYFGMGEQAKDKFRELFDKGELLTQKQHRALNAALVLAAQEEVDTERLVEILGKESSFTNEEIIADFVAQVIEKDGNIREATVDLMYKQSLENEYISSLENLISNPLNYDNLVKPNDASQMKGLSAKIEELLGNDEIDYSSTKNMLSRRFMSDLRHAFVTGKYAIGIAAVAQVGHAQRQRSIVTVDMNRLKNPNMDPIDKIIMGGDPNSELYATDSNMNFKQYNSIMENGKRKPVLSMAKNAVGDYISDIIGQFIDGYVDIAKGPWIMKLGATPNVAGTWLYLLEAGVPAKTVSYFMNQPIIRDYLKQIDNAGYSWLFIDTILESTLEEYEPKTPMSVKGIPSDTVLEKTIGKDVDKLSEPEKAAQQYMLKEFLKYAKTASHLFTVTQGSNFDTANINDPYLVFKKLIMLKRAQNSVISSVDDILDSSFVGNLKNIIMDYRDAFSRILISDRPVIRSMMEQVLLPYVGLSDRDFVKLSQLAVNNLFDWAVQTNTKVNKQVSKTLLGTSSEESVADQIMSYVEDIIGDGLEGSGKPKHRLYNNVIIRSIKKEGGKREGKVDNLYLSGSVNKVYDQNLIIHGFNELREELKREKNLKLYEKLTRLALIQSGLTNSPISFTSLLPYEDFKELYNETLYTLETMDGLEEFYNLDVFQRNNASNSDVAAYKRAKLWFGKGPRGGTRVSNLDVDTLLYTVQDAVENEDLPKIIGISPYSQEGRSDYIVYSWEDSITNEERIHRRKTGDTSHIHKVLAKKVYREVKGRTVPVMQRTKSVDAQGKEKIYEKYIYKAINAWGDSYHAQEFYTDRRPSVLDNDFDKVFNEVNDSVVAKYFRSDGGFEKNPKPGKASKRAAREREDEMEEAAATAPIRQLMKKSGTTVERTTNIITRAFIRSNPKTLFLFGDNDIRKGYGGQAKEMRDEPNAIGISTKKSPNMTEDAFKTDKELVQNKKIITQDINKAISEFKKGGYTKLVIPELGTGLAELQKRAPKTLEFLQQELKRIEDEVSPVKKNNAPGGKPAIKRSGDKC